MTNLEIDLMSLRFVDTHCNVPTFLKDLHHSSFESYLTDPSALSVSKSINDKHFELQAILSVASDTATRAATLEIAALKVGPLSNLPPHLPPSTLFPFTRPVGSIHYTPMNGMKHQSAKSLRP